ncbi:MAG: hypothetical protein DI538_16315 [Azospira oryzae]|jgi:hypothetical protein|nr:MAG: hypothetical protein DI538_16315 [Azospira oryzae]
MGKTFPLQPQATRKVIGLKHLLLKRTRDRVPLGVIVFLSLTKPLLKFQNGLFNPANALASSLKSKLHAASGIKNAYHLIGMGDRRFLSGVE